VRGDGGFFVLIGEATAVAQTRQEVLLAIVPGDGNGDPAENAYRVTYVLQTDYTGEPSEFAWVVPVPATPTDVIAHETSRLFDELSDVTKPRFMVGVWSGRSGSGCACFPTPLGSTTEQSTLVEIEASGQAGILDWAALTSSGGSALLDWLNENGFALPPEAADVLERYIQQDMHFLTLRVREPGEVELEEDGEIAIPPIQFTCQTSKRFYPMAISQISAADETEVVVYVLAEHRAQAANVLNALINQSLLAYDPESPSITNYESLFTQRIAQFEDAVLITESASDAPMDLVEAAWPDAPPGVLDLAYLTRMRTVLSPDQMDLDFEFEDAASDEDVNPEFWLYDWVEVSTASAFGQPLVVLLLFGLFRITVARRANRSEKLK